jgi:hypothetical protein
METSPYCAEEQYAPKNLVRFASGDSTARADRTPTTSGIPLPCNRTLEDMRRVPRPSLAARTGVDDTDSGGSDNPIFGDAPSDGDIGGSDSVKLPRRCESSEPADAPDEPFVVSCVRAKTSSQR